DLGARRLPLPLSGRQLDLGAMAQALGEAGLCRVYCEGGGALAASLLDAGLVDCLTGYTAGLALGAEGQPSLGALGLDRLRDAPRYTLEASRRVGADIEHTWRRSAP
ncbi:MAG: dihydrofolate reductase family protein, partial [Pseudomonadota bacterium]